MSLSQVASCLALCGLAGALVFVEAPALAQSGPVPSAAQRPRPAKVTLKQAGAQLSNKTNVGWDPRHGTQVEYTSADGRAYLWYPTNSVVLAGEWSLEEREVRLQYEGETDIKTIKQPRVCFRYGANTYNPVTGHRGDGWQCTPYVLFQRGSKETRPGDAFGLARRKDVPFVLPKPERLSFAQIAARVRTSSR